MTETIILPGVGHFKDAMSEIKRLNLNAILAKNTDKKMIGICLGMQLMYEHSDEGDASGLGFIQEIFGVSKQNTQCHT